MNKFILSSLFFIFVGNTQATEVKCEICEQVDKLVSDVDNEDHVKAYEQFYALASVDNNLSKDKKVREQEVMSLVKGIIKFMPYDVSKDLPAFALDIQKKNPKDFKLAISKILKSDRESLEKYMKITKDIMDKGEVHAEKEYYKREAKLIGSTSTKAESSKKESEKNTDD